MRRDYDPSEHEIELACKKIRAQWTEAEQQKRLRYDWRTVEARTQEYAVSELSLPETFVDNLSSINKEINRD